MSINPLYELAEHIQDKNYCIAYYYLELPVEEDPYEKAKM